MDISFSPLFLYIGLAWAGASAARHDGVEYTLYLLTVLCTTPPTCGVQALIDIDKLNCALYVPTNSLSTYKDTYSWKEFLLIEEIDSTGINHISNNATNTVFKCYDTNGRLINKPIKGLNIMKMSDETTKKVMVK